jgi:hypothetical protein
MPESQDDKLVIKGDQQTAELSKDYSIEGLNMRTPQEIMNEFAEHSIGLIVQEQDIAIQEVKLRDMQNQKDRLLKRRNTTKKELTELIQFTLQQKDYTTLVPGYKTYPIGNHQVTFLLEKKEGKVVVNNLQFLPAGASLTA